MVRRAAGRVLKERDEGAQVPQGVEADARGIVAPDVGLARFDLERYAASPLAGRLVDRYWVVRWRLPEGESFDQQVWPHPVTNVVFEGAAAYAGGVATRMLTRRLVGTGSVFGVMFRPAGFRPLLGAAMRSITDVTFPLDDVLGPSAGALARAVADAPDDHERVRLVDDHLAGLVPDGQHPAEETMRLVERAAGDRAITRVEQLAALADVSPRTLQRRFADHVGVSPKAVIRRYRLYDAAEAARRSDVDWAVLAVELGYSDQAHLTRDFRAAIGVPPATYARLNRAASTA